MGVEGHRCGFSRPALFGVFKHTRLIQEALECESLKSQGPSQSAGGRGRLKKNKKHGNVQQQKTMTTCAEKKEYIRCMHLFLQLKPEGLTAWLEG